MMMKIEDFDARLTGEESEQQEKSGGWFKRKKKGILTATKDKADAPEGLWSKCPSCKFTCTIAELKENLYVCPKCQYHHRVGSDEYFEIYIIKRTNICKIFHLEHLKKESSFNLKIILPPTIDISQLF